MNCSNFFSLSTESARVNIPGRQAYDLQTFNFNFITHAVFKKKNRKHVLQPCFWFTLFQSCTHALFENETEGSVTILDLSNYELEAMIKVNQPQSGKKIFDNLKQDAVVEYKFVRINIWFTIKSQWFLNFNLKTWLVMSLPLIGVPNKEKDMQTGELRWGVAF